MIEKIKELSELFGVNGEFVDYEVFKSGHINTTLKVIFNIEGREKEYVLQKNKSKRF